MNIINIPNNYYIMFDDGLNYKLVPTDGKKLVVVKREDIDLNSKEGRSLALADNAVANVNLEWDEVNVKEISDEWNINVKDWGVELQKINEKKDEQKDLSDQINIGYRIEISCNSETEQEILYNELIERGLICRLLTL